MHRNEGGTRARMRHGKELTRWEAEGPGPIIEIGETLLGTHPWRNGEKNSSRGEMRKKPCSKG